MKLMTSLFYLTLGLVYKAYDKLAISYTRACLLMTS